MRPRFPLFLFRCLSAFHDGNLLVREPVQPLSRRSAGQSTLEAARACEATPRTRPAASPRAPGRQDRLAILCRVHLQHPLRQVGQEIVHHVRTLLLDYEVASRVFGKADIHLGQEFGEFAVGVRAAPTPHPCGRAQARGWKRICCGWAVTLLVCLVWPGRSLP